MLTIKEKIKAINEIADVIAVKREYAYIPGATQKRFYQWGDTASKVFIEAMNQSGYDIVRKDDE